MESPVVSVFVFLCYHWSIYFMWAYMVAPSCELSSDINEWKIEQFPYEEIILFEQFCFKYTWSIEIPSIDT